MAEVIITCPVGVVWQAQGIFDLAASLQISSEEADAKLLDLIAPYADRVPQKGDHLIFRPKASLKVQVPKQFNILEDN